MTNNDFPNLGHPYPGGPENSKKVEPPTRPHQDTL